MRANTLTVPATLESLERISAVVLAAAKSVGLDESASYRLRLAVDEFATNSIIHGHAGATVPGTLEVTTLVDEQSLKVIIEDSGVPFDPRQVAPPSDMHLPLEKRQIGGLGIYLALKGVDDFRYERIRDRNQNVLIMHLPPTLHGES
jgi:anti-sigma regulatory factor (Ser/Thr protein kinase)